MEHKTAEDLRQNEEPEDRRDTPQGVESASDTGGEPTSDQQAEEVSSDFQGDNSEQGGSEQQSADQSQPAESDSKPRGFGPSVYLAQRGARRGRRMSLRESRLASRHRGVELPIRQQFRNESPNGRRAEGQADRPVRERVERPERGERPERPERPERAERPERPDRNVERPDRNEPRMSPQKIASLREIRAHVERVRQTLEGVLRDLSRIADQLTFAEKEKDVAEEEIENLKDQLRRLHR